MKDKILSLRNEGKSYREIEKILKCSRSLIAYYVNSTTKIKCISNQHKKRIKQKKNYSLILGGKCERCGYDKCPQALHFHHKDASTKLFEITTAIWGKSGVDENKIIEEIKKCTLLCANCHAEIHWEESGCGSRI